MLRIRILGPLEVENEQGLVQLGGARQRAVLAVLVLRANEIVPKDSLFTAVWGERPPRDCRRRSAQPVGQLRKLLGAASSRLGRPAIGCACPRSRSTPSSSSDSLQRARDQSPEDRTQTLAKALALWRGEPLADLAFENFAQEEIRRLLGLRTHARIERIRAEIECGRHADVVAEAESLHAADPLHEGLANLLIVALYRCGRQAEAMRAFLQVRKLLDEQFGQPPGAELQETYRMILQHARALAAPVGSSRTQDDRFEEIVRAALASPLVPVLGPGLSGSAPALDPAAVAVHLAQRFGCPAEYCASLARVGQWVTVTHGVGPLYDELHALYSADFEPGPVHRALAWFPPILRARGLPCQLLLTSGFDRMLEQALIEAGEQYDVVSFIALGRDRGKFLHVAADGAARVIDEPNREVDLAAGARTLILKLNGGTDALSGRVRDSYVVSEDDYIDYLAQSDVSALLPIGLAAHIRRSHLLFVGYDLCDWSPRVFLRRLWGEERMAYRSWAIGRSSPSRFCEAQWRQLGVDVIAVAPEESFGASGPAPRCRSGRGGRVSTRVPILGEKRSRPTSPFKGLAPFEDSELDEQLFFGRERERSVIVANVVAARLTVLYGPTGVGKSSVLRAGVARDLRALPEEPLVVVCDSWAESPATTLAAAVAGAASIEPAALAETIEIAAAEHREIYLLLDQVEEYFVYHGGDPGAR